LKDQPYPIPYGLRNPYRNLKSENSQEYAQKPQQNCMFMNSASALPWDGGMSEMEDLGSKSFRVSVIFNSVI
jgi:hypothetical protein